jgi:hypothetical protein
MTQEVILLMTTTDSLSSGHLPTRIMQPITNQQLLMTLSHIVNVNTKNGKKCPQIPITSTPCAVKDLMHSTATHLL